MSLHQVVKNLDEIKYLTPGFITCRMELYLGDSLLIRLGIEGHVTHTREFPVFPE
jgi:hypothetical protein